MIRYDICKNIYVFLTNPNFILVKKIHLLLVLICPIFSFSQGHFLSKIPLSEQVASAEVIAEGKVVAKKSYWDKGKKNIYTVHIIDVSKSYKGSAAHQLHIVTLGGTVGLKAVIARPSLSLEKDAAGVFVAEAFPLELEGFASNAPLYRTIGVSQGFYRYNASNTSVINPFAPFDNYKTFDDTLISLTRQVPKQLKEVNYFESKKKSNTQVNAAVAATITSISPTQIVAGNKSVLTISGSGFGTTKGTVRFKNADNAGATTEDALETQIVSWTDTEIKVEVPGKAGTGDVEVETTGGVKSQISGLVITHAFITIRYTDTQYNVQSGKEAEHHLHHVGSDHNASGSQTNFDNGAYLFKYHTDFKNNTAAVTSFEDGFDPIVCGSGIDFKISSTTTTAKSVEDNINSISFDTTQSGVLGQAVVRLTGGYQNCNGVTQTCLDMYWFYYEIDYVFDQNQSWDFDLDGNTTSSEYDFNAVVRHETGHAVGLGHVIDNQKLMHYSLSKGPHQSLNSNTMYTPIQNKITFDKATTPVQGMSTTDFSSCYTLSSGELADSPFTIYPNPTSGTLSINSKQPIEAATVYTVLGNRVQYASEAEGIGTLQLLLNVSDLTQGVYFVSVETKLGSQSLRFIKE